jgi:hypothetical protein
MHAVYAAAATGSYQHGLSGPEVAGCEVCMQQGQSHTSKQASTTFCTDNGAFITQASHACYSQHPLLTLRSTGPMLSSSCGPKL